MKWKEIWLSMKYQKVRSQGNSVEKVQASYEVALQWKKDIGEQKGILEYEKRGSVV